MHVLATSIVVLDVGRSLRQAFFMFWETLWPLVLGFALSGVVQAFVSRQSIQRRLGDHGPMAILRASGYGMASSSCSYAATAMAKSLFVKGADYLAAMVFMFASTNLVIELGIVLIVLMGWQFALSEFVGGAIMIVLLATFGSLWFRGRRISQARERLLSEQELEAPGHDPEASTPGSLRNRLRSAAGWADGASYTLADLRMIRRELVIGYVAAGFLAALVPASAWHFVFATGHGFWTDLENAIVGPFVAIISCVCSIGNVALAAALWKGGISFGGVVSFIFADLIALPLLMIYRRYYGWRLMLRMLAVFWVLMAAAGLLTGGLFSAAGLAPTTHRATIAVDHFSWDATTYLNIVGLAVFGLLVWLAHNRTRFGGGQQYAADPVCGMQVETMHAPASALHDNQRVFFCSDRCKDRFVADPVLDLVSSSAGVDADHDRAQVAEHPVR
ncbi:MAG TPA: permease [Acidimicrobiales bacterium]|jgi:hypothetical protein